MKNLLILFAATALVAFMFGACDSKTKLADQISGSWTSAPEMLENNVGSQSTVIKVFDLQKVDGEAGGSVIVSGLVSVTSEVAQSDSLVQPISYTASGVATIRGTWTATDDDDVALMLDPTTMTVQVDPSAVQLNYDVLTDASQPDTTNLLPSVVARLKAEITRQLQADFFNAKKIDDIKVKGNILNCEINDRDLTLRRQIAD